MGPRLGRSHGQGVPASHWPALTNKGRRGGEVRCLVLVVLGGGDGGCNRFGSGGDDLGDEVGDEDGDDDDDEEGDGGGGG